MAGNGAGMLVYILVYMLRPVQFFPATLLIGGGLVITLPVLLLSFANSDDYAITAALSWCSSPWPSWRCYSARAIWPGTAPSCAPPDDNHPMNSSTFMQIAAGGAVAGQRKTAGVLAGRQPLSGHRSTRVSLAGLSKRSGHSHALRDLTPDLPAGKITALRGPSACGKTTTPKMIAGLIEPTGGDIAFDGASVLRTPVERRGAVMVFQNHLLFPYLSVAENVAFGLAMRRESRAAIQRKESEMLARVRLAGFEERRPRQLSSGQAQRVALARALVVEPHVLLLDEPLSNLDAHLRDEMRELILDLQRQSGITTVFVTHDQEEAVLLADRVALMLDGQLQQVGEPSAFYKRPASAAVARFFGAVNFLPGTRAGHPVHTALGCFHVASLAQPEGPVTLTIRPENVRLCCSDQAPEENSIAGVVARRAYAGTHTRLKVEAAGQRLEVVADASQGSRFADGDPVCLHFPPERLWRLPAAHKKPDPASSR